VGILVIAMLVGDDWRSFQASIPIIPDPEGLGFVTTGIRFPDDVTDEEIMNVFQQGLLSPPSLSRLLSLLSERIC